MKMEQYTCSVCRADYKLSFLYEPENYREKMLVDGHCCPCCGKSHRTRLLTNEDVILILKEMAASTPDEHLQRLNINREILEKSIKRLENDSSEGEQSD